MTAEFAITPSRILRVEQSQLSSLAGAGGFDTGTALLMLAVHPSLRHESEASRFFFQIVESFMRKVCSLADVGTTRVDVDTDSVLKWKASCPPITGVEFADESFFIGLWDSMQREFWNRCGLRPLRQFLADEFPLWADAGRVFLHMAENKSNDVRPFSILLTYGVRDVEKARLQHRPIGLALTDAGKANDSGLVETLLRVLSRAAEVSTEFAKLYADRSLYRAINLDPTAAYRLIQEFPLIESAGIPCKVPEYWERGRPQKAEVSVTFKAGPRSQTMNRDNVLGFDVGVALGSDELTPEEIQDLLNGPGPLTSIRGKWVEVNPKRIGRLLDRWQAAAAMRGECGVSFGEALRWSSEFSGDPSSPGGDAEEQSLAGDERVRFQSDEELTKLLASLRDPELADSQLVDSIVKEQIRANLRPYQVRGVSWLSTIAKLGMGGCLADDMGLGKTLQIIALLAVEKFSRPDKGHKVSLLVVPASLIGNWTSELARFAPELRVKVLHPSVGEFVDQAASDTFLADADVVITTYGMVTRPGWLGEIEWHLLVADEAQALKNPGSKQSIAVRSLKAHARFALTGTPVENNLTDLWSIFDFAAPGLLGTKQTFAQKVKPRGESAPDYSRLRSVISPWMLRRQKTDRKVITDLPDKTELKTFCLLSKDQAALYAKQVAEAEAAIASADGISRKGIIFSTILRLKQICNHPSQRRGDATFDASASGKFLVLRDLCGQICDRQEKVLVFTQFRELTDILAHELEQIFKRPGLVLHGSTEIGQRRQLVESFQSDDGPPFFVLSVKAGGTGLNLTAASHVIHFDRWWNPAVENQATDRAYRIGQKRNVLVHKFICKGTIEERIDELIEGKRSLAENVVGESSEINLSNLSDEELFGLMRLREGPLQGIDD